MNNLVRKRENKEDNMSDVPATRTVIGLFDTYAAAQQSVRDLVENGFSRDNISLVTQDPQGRAAEAARDVGGSHETAEGAGFGAVGGSVVGGLTGLLVGIGALAIPGIGPVIAAGPFAAAIGATAAGAGLGAATGGIVGALVGLGIAEPEANNYAEAVRRGGTMVIVEAAGIMVDRAYEILQRHGSVDLNARAAQWRQSGWTTFDPNDAPYQGG